MSKSMSFLERVNYQGVDRLRTRSVTADAETGAEPVGDVPAAKTGTLTTRTNNTDGTITLDPGHGLSTGRMDLYWSGGSRRGVAGTVTSDSLAITGGTGDNLPAQSTAVRATAPHVEAVNFTGSNAVAALLWSALATADYPGWIVFTTSGDAEVKAWELTGSLPTWSWDSGGDATNPFSGQTVAKVYFSHGNTDAVRNMGVGVLYN